MKFIETSLAGVVICEPARFSDERGFFQELFHEDRYREEGGINCQFKQDNTSYSRQGVVRGLHYQLRNPQAKLVSVLKGVVVDVAVDIRKGSPTFGAHVAVELSADNGRQLFVPEGFAHGFSVISEDATFLYKCSDVYAPGDEFGIRFDDPELKIDWGVSAPVVSQKDLSLPTLSGAPSETLPEWNEGN